MSVAVHVDGSSTALAALAAAVRRLGDARPMFDEIGAALVTSAQMRFEAEAGPEGSPWPRSVRAMLDGGKTLTDTARLRASLTHVAHADSVEVGTNVLYAAIHQFGGTIRARTKRGLRFRPAGNGGDVVRRSVTLPARPFLGLSDTDAATILKIVAAHLDGGADAA